MPHTSDVHSSIQPKRYLLEGFLHCKQDTSPAGRPLLPQMREMIKLFSRLMFPPRPTTPEVYLEACTEPRPSTRTIGHLLDKMDGILHAKRLNNWRLTRDEMYHTVNLPNDSSQNVMGNNTEKVSLGFSVVASHFRTWC